MNASVISIHINDMMALHALSAACDNGLFVVKHMPPVDKSTLSSAINLSAVSRHNGRPVWLLSKFICCRFTTFPWAQLRVICRRLMCQHRTDVMTLPWTANSWPMCFSYILDVA